MRITVGFKLTALVSALALAAAGCGDDDAGAESLVDTQWRLASLGENVPTVPDVAVTLDFVGADAVNGVTGCNAFQGPYQADGSDLTIGPLAMTRAACPDAALTAQETGFLAALERAQSFEIDGDVLLLQGPEGTTLAQFDRFSFGLDGTAWSVVSYNDGREAVVSVITGTEITARFDATTVMGSGGCNDYNGSYQADGSAIEVGPLAATERSCPEPAGVDAQEVEYFAALESAATWSLIGNDLELRTGEGQIAVRFRPAS